MSLRQELERNGFVIVEGLLEEPWLTKLRDACKRVLKRARARPHNPERWNHVRAVGKQFPPFPEDREDIWGVQHLMHPDLHEPIFLEWYTSLKLLETVSEIIGADIEDLQLELFNLLVNPQKISFSLAWHRDNIRPEATAEEELIELQKPLVATQWNAALYDDECLIVIPGSHRRPRTEDERRINLEGDFKGTMPSEERVLVPAGRVLFYDHNILHRATYSTSPIRATLHGCMSSAKHASPERARVILQHELGWIKDMDLPENSHAIRMRARLLEMAEKLNQAELGYSLEG